MIRKILLFLIVVAGGSVVSAGPYPPPAGELNSTAVYMDDPAFVGWATGITVQRGYIDITEPNLGYVSHGSGADALGKAQGDLYSVVSLGDGGAATLTFENPAVNGPGYDFAVFENAFNDTFLELAFVEVSSNGVDFFRFDSVSLTQTEAQISNSGSVDTTQLHNLAGKYRHGYGTPFDLEELKDVNSVLDVNQVTHIRIIDVVGYIQPTDVSGDGIVNFADYGFFAAAYPSDPNDSNWDQRCDFSQPADNLIDRQDFVRLAGDWLQDYARCDSQGNKINDPWPTPFATGGFDLDAVGVINQKE